MRFGTWRELGENMDNWRWSYKKEREHLNEAIETNMLNEAIETNMWDG